MSTKPFGGHVCEHEIKKLGDGYSELFFSQTPFNHAALSNETYLIVGRRGAGKTALCHYFSFQQDIKNVMYIDVDEPKVYDHVLSKIASHIGEDNDVLRAKSADIWEYLIWKLIIDECEILSSGVTVTSDSKLTPAGILDKLVDWLSESIGMSCADGRQNGLSEGGLNSLLTAENFTRAKAQVLSSARKTPIFLAVDTLEKYNIDDSGLMKTMAGLVETASKINLEHSTHGIHVKVFMSGEVFPHLLEVELANPLKNVRDEVYMLWRSRDILRLIAWRFHHFLKGTGHQSHVAYGAIDWDDPKSVLENIWAPYFGKEIKNKNGITENSFAYVLRHTQMRPRQMIFICNAIAARSLQSGTFPLCKRDDVIGGIDDAEQSLSSEIVNSYSQIYPGANNIVRVLSNIDTVFTENRLDKIAPTSRKYWKNGEYSPATFSRLVTELGIVGRVTRQATGYVSAEYSYSQKKPIDLMSQDICAIHPMFFQYLNIKHSDEPVIVMPFKVSDDQKWLV